MTIVVTGAAGFIGCNIVRGLNQIGITNIFAVDDLTDGEKFRNLAACRIADYIHWSDFYEAFDAGKISGVSAVFHQGACSDTVLRDGRAMMQQNYEPTRRLYDTCVRDAVRLIYASSAAVYGASTSFAEVEHNERPLNIYGYSKLLFDQFLRQQPLSPAVNAVGFRYFNVYGPFEQHKGRMASVAFHQYQQMKSDGYVRLFGEYDGYDAGMQQRDFIHVDDIVAVNLWALANPSVQGIFNLGTGRAEPFNAVAEATVNGVRQAHGERELSLAQMVSQQLVRYVEFPDDLKGRYQSYTQADISALRRAGCEHNFLTVAQGVASYIGWMSAGGVTTALPVNET